MQTGIGITTNPVPRPGPPTVDWVPSTLGDMALFVRTAWIGTQGAEGSGSIEQAITVPAGNALRVMPEIGPSGVTGWNVYVGLSSGETTLQNTDPLDPETAWVMPNSGLVSGNPIEDGQLPEVFKTLPRFLQRG